MTTLKVLRRCRALVATMLVLCAGCGPDLEQHRASCPGDTTVTLANEPWGNGTYVTCHETKAQRDAAIAREEQK